MDYAGSYLSGDSQILGWEGLRFGIFKILPILGRKFEIMVLLWQRQFEVFAIL